MQLDRIVIATDESEQGRQAVRVGRELARRTRPRTFIMRVLPRRPQVEPVAGPDDPTFEQRDASESARLRRWLGGDLAAAEREGEIELAVAAGVPSIEITRYAENHGADLLVLGRKVRSQAARLLVGDTADAVARRSRVPCLFVPSGAGAMRSMLTALDGSERGMMVLQQACGFARATEARLGVVTVEPAAREAGGAPPEPPLALSQRLVSRAQEIVRRELGDGARAEVAIRRGAIVEQVLAAVEETHPDVLAIGFHRGGPPGVLEAGSTARRLAHLAPCAVLTIPL